MGNRPRCSFTAHRTSCAATGARQNENTYKPGFALVAPPSYVQADSHQPPHSVSCLRRTTERLLRKIEEFRRDRRDPWATRRDVVASEPRSSRRTDARLRSYCEYDLLVPRGTACLDPRCSSIVGDRPPVPWKVEPTFGFFDHAPLRRDRRVMSSTCSLVACRRRATTPSSRCMNAKPMPCASLHAAELSAPSKARRRPVPASAPGSACRVPSAARTSRVRRRDGSESEAMSRRRDLSDSSPSRSGRTPSTRRPPEDDVIR